ncbi:cellulose binding domain-containing protein [Chitinophaga tropicalis]
MIAIWNLSLMWYFTGNQAYAIKARDILLAWANTQTQFLGVEANLDLGDYAYAWGGAASILRGTWSGWTTANTATVKNFFNSIYWPASGCHIIGLGPANKGALSIASGAAIAAFSDDYAKIDRVIYLFRYSGSAGFPNTLPNGQIGESGRDQGHANGTILSYAFAAEVLWKQGIDLFSEYENRLLATGEYFSRKNSGVPQRYITYGTTDALYWTDQTDIWGGGRMMFMILNGAYGVRKGMQLPYVNKRLFNGSRIGATDTWFYKTLDSSTASIAPGNIVIPPATLSGSGLTDFDIGDASPVGSSSFNNNTWTVTGGGLDMWTHGSESFHFVYKEVTGNCSIIAKVESIGSTSTAAKAGVMIRSDLTGNAAQRVWMAITPLQRGEGFMHGWADVFGGANWEKQSRGIPQVPYWVKIERIGEKIATYYSPDGASWAAVTEGRFPGFSGTAYIGLVVSSGTNSTPITSTFSNVSMTGGSGGTVTKPAAPYSVHACGGDGQVQVRWLSSFGATGYNLKRSASPGGPFTTIAGNLHQNSFFDNNVANGQTYYYAVSAVNDAGESIDSPVDFANPRLAYVSVPINGMYRIIARHSGKVLGVRGAVTTDGGLIEQNTYTFAANQHWNVTHLGNGEYKLINVLSGKALDVAGDSIVDGSALEQRAYSTSDTGQVWKIFDRGDETYNIIGKQSGKAAEVKGGGAADGAAVSLYNWTDGNNQIYIFEPVILQDLFEALRKKLAEAINWRDSTLTTATGELGKYPLAVNNMLNDTVLFVQHNFDSLTTTVNEAGWYITMLTNAINRYKSAYLFETNNLADGVYYIKPYGLNTFWTGNTTNSPSFESENVNRNLQRWRIAKESNNRYKITCLTAPVTPYKNFINESAQFSINDYYVEWNTMNIYYNGTSYALQRAQSAGNGYWYINSSKILAVGGGTNDPFPGSFPFTLIPSPDSQSIVFDSLAPRLIGDTAFALEARSSAGLPVIFSSSDTTVARILDGKLYMLKPGTADIAASQPGTDKYDAAIPVVRRLNVRDLGISLLYADGDAGNLSNNSVKPYFKLINNGSIAVDLSQITIRYWLTPENFNGAINGWIDYAQLPIGNLALRYVETQTARQKAIGYMEYVFTPSAGMLMTGSNTGEIQSRLANSNWADLDEENDYSYLSATSYTANQQVTVYRNGVLVWGIEPSQVPPALAVRVFTESRSSGSNTINSIMRLQNEGNRALNYNDLKVRYWFTRDGEAPLNYWLDYVASGDMQVTGLFMKPGIMSDSADIYLELSFTSGHSKLYPLSNTGDIQYRITKQDWSAFNQLNDYSYLSSVPLAENSRVTVYYKGNLLYGVEPSIGLNAARQAAPVTMAKESSMPRVYPNPAQNMFYIRLGMKPGTSRYTFTVRLMDSQGRPVFNRKISDYKGGVIELQIPVQMPAGIYWVVIDGENPIPLTIIK